MQSIFLCNPKIIMSRPLPASCHQSQGLRQGKQSRPTLLPLDIRLPGSQGLHSHCRLYSPVVAHLPLSSPVGWPHTNTFLVPGVAPVSPHLLLRWDPTHCSPSSFPFSPEREGQRSRHYFHPGNFRDALVPQGQGRPPAFHLYQDCLHTFVMKGSVQWKQF